MTADDAKCAACADGRPCPDHPPAGPGPVIHVAGVAMRVTDHIRQRCSWCGAVLIDVDITTIDRPAADVADLDPDDPFAWYPVWETGRLVAHDGAASYLVDDIPSPSNPDIPGIPPESCMALHPDLTGVDVR